MHLSQLIQSKYIADSVQVKFYNSSQTVYIKYYILLQSVCPICFSINWHKRQIVKIVCLYVTETKKNEQQPSKTVLITYSVTQNNFSASTLSGFCFVFLESKLAFSVNGRVGGDVEPPGDKQCFSNYLFAVDLRLLSPDCQRKFLVSSDEFSFHNFNQFLFEVLKDAS